MAARWEPQLRKPDDPDVVEEMERNARDSEHEEPFDYAAIVWMIALIAMAIHYLHGCLSSVTR